MPVHANDEWLHGKCAYEYLKKMSISSPKLVLTSKWTNFTGFRSPSPVRLVAAACGASATSEKTRPGILEHVSCGFCHFLNDFQAGTCGIQAGTCGICIMKWCREVLLGAPLPHAPGVGMT